MADLRHILKCTLRFVFVLLNNTYCIPTYLVWMWVFFWPLRFLHLSLYWFIEGVLFKWLLCMVSAWSYGAGYRVVEVGEDLSSCYNKRCLVLSNHQSTSDVPFLMAAFQQKKDITPSLLWIMDRLFRYTNFGLVSWTHGDFFITQGKEVRESQIKKLENHLLNVYLERNRKWIVLFPEGGFLCKRLETSQRYAQKNNFPILKHVTLPRVGAMYSIMKTLSRDNIKNSASHLEAEHSHPLEYLVDITVAYPQGEALSLPSICSSWHPPCKVYLHYRCFPIEEVPQGSLEEVQDWIYDRWAEKEELLEEFYTTGVFPALPKSQKMTNQLNGRIHKGKLLREPREVTFSYYWIGFLHLFFITSTLLHTWMFWRLAQICGMFS